MQPRGEVQQQQIMIRPMQQMADLQQQQQQQTQVRVPPKQPQLPGPPIVKQMIRPTKQKAHRHQPQQLQQSRTKRKDLEQQIVALQASVRELKMRAFNMLKRQLRKF
jgi:hypothetical protein